MCQHLHRTSGLLGSYDRGDGKDVCRSLKSVSEVLGDEAYDDRMDTRWICTYQGCLRRFLLFVDDQGQKSE